MSKLQFNKKAGLYYRLSKDDERIGESLSIGNQKLILERYARENGFEIVDEYIDDGYSGTNFNRPGLKRLIEDAQCGRIDTIIVKDLSRFGRDYLQVGQYTEYIFPEFNIRFIAVTDNVDSAIQKDDDLDTTPLKNIFNEWQAANTSRKIKRVIEAGAKAGKYRVCQAPYGYVKGTDEKKLPVIDEPAASNVRRMFEMRASGISPNKIAQTFNDEHIPIPSDYKEEKFGIPNTRRSHHLWSCATVKQILNNPIYLGHLVQMRTTTVSYKNKKKINRDPEDMIITYNTHEAIVSQELWDKCREMEASVSQGKKTNTGYVHPLSGLVYCADCGNKMYMKYNNTRHSRKGPRIYYRENYSCGAYEKFGSRACSSHYIQIKILNQIVLQDIRSKIDLVSIDEKKARTDFLRQRDKLAKKEETESRKQLRKDKARLEELGKLLSSVYEDKVMGRIPEDVCIELLKKYQVEKTEIVTEIAALESKLSEMEKTTADVDEFIRRLKTYLDVPELTREMCMELIEFVTVDECPGKYSKEPREIHIYYKLIDKQPLPVRKCLEDSTCADN